MSENRFFSGVYPVLAEPETQERDWAQWDAERASSMHEATADKAGQPKQTMNVQSLKSSEVGYRCETRDGV